MAKEKRITVETDVYVSLDEFETLDLVEELEYRNLSKFPHIYMRPKVLSLADHMKIEFLEKNLDKILLEDLEGLIKK